MQPTLARVIALGAALLAAGGIALASGASAATAARTTPPTPAPHRVVVVGVDGLRWTDVSATATPALWRLAGSGSVGSLVVSGITPLACPADGWLTLNAAARAAAPRTAAGACQPLPAVTRQSAATEAIPAVPVAAQVSAMARLVRYNTGFSANPHWGLLRSAAGPGGCATAVGPGAALALASRTGQVSSYLPAAASLTQADIARCPLTMVDLGTLQSAAGQARAAQVRAGDREIGRISAELPAGTILVVTSPADDGAPHLRLIVIGGPGFRSGLLVSPSTRQPGLTVLTDLTPSILHWRGQPVPLDAVGATLRRADRDSLAAAISGLIGQDTAAQVYKATMTWFFLIVGFGYAALFALIGVLPWGRGETRRQRRRAVARVAGVWAASVPAGSFLASLVPWWTLPHPALLLYTMAAAWAVVIAAAALSGPWRRDPLGPPGFVGAVTLGVIAIDVMTGSHLQLGTPFGLSALVAGRFYGIGNNAVEIYAASALLLSAWLGGAALRQGDRRRGLLTMAAVAAFAVVAAGWPGFGAKVGGTIAMVPGFLLLMAAAAGAAINLRRGLIVAVSGVALVTVFAVVNYLLPGTGHSDIGAFVGQVLHGGASGTLHRKISSNIGSLTVSMWSLVVPVVVVAGGLLVFWPARFRAGLLARGYASIPLLRPALGAIWLVGVLGWAAEDSGVTVPAAELPLVLPLIVVILCGLPLVSGGRGQPAGPEGGQPGTHAANPAANPAADPASPGGDRSATRSGNAGYL